MTNADDGLLSIDEAVEQLKSSRSTVYRWLKTGELRGTKVGRQWRVHPDEIDRFMRGEAPQVTTAKGVAPFAAQLQDLLGEHADAPDDVMQSVTLMARVALSRSATQFSLEPHLTGDGSIRGWFRIRADGALTTAATVDGTAVSALIEGWKRWAGCDPHTTQEIQHGRAVLAVSADRRPIDVRLTFVPTVLGESVSVTVLDPNKTEQYIDLDRLDYSSDDRARIDRALGAPWGTTIVTGPSGSGKSTFLYACLRELASPQRQSIAIEAPVEWRVPGVMHVPVQEDQGVTFPNAIRAAMHCDPDVLMVSEIRDKETLQLAPSVALTGHQVLTALHAPTAIDAIIRMSEFGLERHTIAEATRLIVAQQLVRKLCPACRRPHTPPEAALKRAAAHVDLDVLTPRWHEAVGCPECGNTGYRGRRVIAETVEMTDTLRAAIRDGAAAEKLWKVAESDGSSSMISDGIRRAAAGETSLDEVWRIIGLS